MYLIDMLNAAVQVEHSHVDYLRQHHRRSGKNAPAGVGWYPCMHVGGVDVTDDVSEDKLR